VALTGRGDKGKFGDEACFLVGTGGGGDFTSRGEVGVRGRGLGDKGFGFCLGGGAWVPLVLSLLEG